MEKSRNGANFINCFGAIFFILFFAGLASANSFWISPTVGYSRYNMSGVNDDIQSYSFILPEAGSTKIESGYAYGGRIGWGFNNPVTFGFGYEQLAASTLISSEIYSLEYELPADIYLTFFQWAVLNGKPWKTSLGLTVGKISANGNLSASSTDSGSVSRDIKASGLLVEGAVTTEWRFHLKWAVNFDLGYRYAELDEIKDGNEIIYASNGEPLDIDYSGLIARFGLKFFFDN